jgi:hypothetical protein
MTKEEVRARREEMRRKVEAMFARDAAAPAEKFKRLKGEMGRCASREGRHVRAVHRCSRCVHPVQVGAGEGDATSCRGGAEA